MPIALLLFLLFSLPARAAAPSAVLAEALEQAWRIHPEAGALSARQAAAEAGGRVSDSLIAGPAALSFGVLDDRLGGDRGRREWEVEVSAPLWLPGQRAARGVEAEAALAETALHGAALRLRLAGELRLAAWQWAAARAGRDLAERRLAGARTLEADVQRRYQAGDLARVDANLAANERLAAAAELHQASAALAEAELDWRRLTGAAAPEALTPEDAAQAAPEADAHPELRALSGVARLAQARLTLARQTRREPPELALRLVRERADADDAYASAVGLKLNLPLSSAARVQHDEALARAELSLADAEVRRLRARIAGDVEAAGRRLEAAERRLAIASERQALIADNLALAEKAFALGESDLPALLRNRALVLEVEANLTGARIERAAAVSRLLQAKGVLP